MNKIKPLVCICIPVYNTLRYLPRCLDSVKNQSYYNIKVICVDDCSADSSCELIDTYVKTDSRFVLIRHKLNCGLAMARNTVIDYIAENIPDTGYIMFIDSDDYINTKAVENLVSIADQSDADIVLTSLTRVSSVCDESKNNNNSSFTYLLADYESTMNKIITDEIGSQVCGKLFRMHCFDGVRFPRKKYYFEDLMTTHLICNKAKKIAITDLICYYYYDVRPDSISNAPKNLIKGSLDRSIAFFERYEYCNNKYPKYVQNIVLRKAVDFAGGALRRLNRKSFGIEDAELVRSYIRKHKYDILKCKKIKIYKRFAVLILEKIKYQRDN